jgi:hypothetical protein
MDDAARSKPRDHICGSPARSGAPSGKKKAAGISSRRPLDAIRRKAT